MSSNYRTDLAYEAVSAEGLTQSVEGLRVCDEALYGLHVQTVEISDENAAQLLHKPTGKYYSILLPEDRGRGGEQFENACNAISSLLKRCFNMSPRSCLIAALGNPDITPDAIGPISASYILVTRHLKEKEAALFSSFSSVALCRTGVLGTTGVESALQIKNLCSAIKPDCVIAIDALAGSEAESLCRTVQISNTGIAPGSGVNNDRLQLSIESLGVPVVALGVPTVIDAGSISGDRRHNNMFVTPRDIDSKVRSCARFVAYGVNLALHPGLTIEEIDLLLG